MEKHQACTRIPTTAHQPSHPHIQTLTQLTVKPTSGLHAKKATGKRHRDSVYLYRKLVVQTIHFVVFLTTRASCRACRTRPNISSSVGLSPPEEQQAYRNVKLKTHRVPERTAKSKQQRDVRQSSGNHQHMSRQACTDVMAFTHTLKHRRLHKDTHICMQEDAATTWVI